MIPYIMWSAAYVRFSIIIFQNVLIKLVHVNIPLERLYVLCNLNFVKKNNQKNYIQCILLFVFGSITRQYYIGSLNYD